MKFNNMVDFQQLIINDFIRWNNHKRNNLPVGNVHMFVRGDLVATSLGEKLIVKEKNEDMNTITVIGRNNRRKFNYTKDDSLWIWGNCAL